MGLIKIKLSPEFLINALKLNNDFDITDIEISYDEGTYKTVFVTLKHSNPELDGGKYYKPGKIHYETKLDDKGNEITKIKKIVVDGKEIKFDGIDYYKEPEEAKIKIGDE
jgi:hypothetical protein